MSPGRTTSGFQGMTVVTVANFGVNSVTLPSWKRYQGGPFPVLRTTFTIEANLDVKSITKILDDPHIDEHITCMLHTTDTDGNDTRQYRYRQERWSSTYSQQRSSREPRQGSIPQDIPHTSLIWNIESSNSVQVPICWTIDTTLCSTCFESYDTLAVFDVLHSLINPRECFSNIRSRLIVSSLFRISVKTCFMLDNFHPNCAYVAGMSSKGRTSSDSTGKLVELTFHQSNQFV